MVDQVFTDRFIRWYRSGIESHTTRIIIDNDLHPVIGAALAIIGNMPPKARDAPPRVLTGIGIRPNQGCPIADVNMEIISRYLRYPHSNNASKGLSPA